MPVSAIVGRVRDRSKPALAAVVAAPERDRRGALRRRMSQARWWRRSSFRSGRRGEVTDDRVPVFTSAGIKQFPGRAAIVARHEPHAW